MDKEQIADAMDFFRHTAGEWKSRRVTHHLPFRRSEMGGSMTCITPLEASDPKVIEICQMHDIDPSLSVGGALVTWNGEMDWDKDDENHKGESVMAIVPDEDSPRKGRLLRERGYAETAPIVGRYEMDDDDALILLTDYETMSSVERFSFVEPGIRLRTSAVKRFGGFSTATFCTEVRSDRVAVSSSENSSGVTQAAGSALGW